MPVAVVHPAAAARRVARGARRRRTLVGFWNEWTCSCVLPPPGASSSLGAFRNFGFVLTMGIPAQKYINDNSTSSIFCVCLLLAARCLDGLYRNSAYICCTNLDLFCVLKH